ncbi:MAG: RNA methyltransferase [Catalinimonas sp.]
MRKLRNDELDRLTADEYRSAAKHPFAFVLDQVRSALNVGSIFRTADAFRAERVVLCGITAQPPHREIQKTALGATDAVPWEHHAATLDAVAHLRAAGYRIVSVEQAEGSTSLPDFRPEPGARYAFILGHEMRGVDAAVVAASDLCLEIPQWGTKHSLNVSVTAGVVAWSVVDRLRRPQQ